MFAHTRCSSSDRIQRRAPLLGHAGPFRYVVQVEKFAMFESFIRRAP